jgi:hypothetical protein
MFSFLARLGSLRSLRPTSVGHVPTAVERDHTNDENKTIDEVPGLTEPTPPKQVASTKTKDVEEAISGTLGWTHEQDYEPDWAFPPPFSTD